MLVGEIFHSFFFISFNPIRRIEGGPQPPRFPRLFMGKHDAPLRKKVNLKSVLGFDF